MRRFILRSVLFIISLITTIILIITIFSQIVENRHFLNYQTESNLLVFDKNVNYDILFMGISHARNFSRHKNQLRIEEITNKKVANIGQGGGACGVNEQLFYLDYFYFQNNTAKQIIYVLSPPMVFSETLPIASNTFNYESFELLFLIKYLNFDSENKYQRILSYLRS